MAVKRDGRQFAPDVAEVDLAALACRNVGQFMQFSDSGVFPAVNVTENADNLYLTAEIPGIRPGEIDIPVEGKMPALHGEHKLQGVPNVRFHRNERAGGRLHKALTLLYAVNADKATAAYEDGVLRWTLPKAEEVKSK